MRMTPDNEKGFGVPSLGPVESIDAKRVKYIDSKRTKSRIVYGEENVANNTQISTKRSQSPVNDIIVKIEMKKFQNLIANRRQRKNNLVNQDIKRIYPLNKI